MSRVAFAAAGLLLAGSAQGRTLLVGEGREFPLPSAALAAAHDGDTVSLAPGTYFDCAIVRADGVAIVGEKGAEPAAMSDKVCEEKAILVLRGSGTSVRDLTLQRARAPDGNGAGIRLEGADLSVERVRFVNDQVGILSGSTGGIVNVVDSSFIGGGVGGERPKYALMIGRAARLLVRGCTFADGKGGQVATAADRSEITGSTIGVGAGDEEEPPSYAVLATDGALLMDDDTLAVGPMPPRPRAAIGMWDAATAVIRRIRMTNATGQRIALVKDWSWSDPVLSDNSIGSGDELLSSSGSWRHRASNQFYLRKEQARALASQVKQMVKHALGR